MLWSRNTKERDGQMNSPLPRKEENTKLDGGDEVAVQGDVAVRHARRIEGETGIPLAVEKDEATSGVRAFGEKVKKIDGGFGHNNFHDGFAVARARDAASFGVGVAAAADERRIADTTGEFATSPS